MQDGERPATVLVAEDDPLNRRVLRAILSAQGLTVLEAADGQAAVARFARDRPDVVLMDVDLPILDGVSATAEIKRLAGDELVPVILVTAMHQAELLGQALRAGADDYLLKPYDRLLLERKVAAWLRTRALFQKSEQQRLALLAQEEQVRREHRIAEKIASNIINRGCLDATCIRYFLSPMAVFNGDVLLAAPTRQGGVRVMLGDLTGHGLSAAIGALPIAETFFGATANGVAAGPLLCQLNAKLGAVLPTGMFCAAFLLELDLRDGRALVWNGGMPDALVRAPDGRVTASIPSAHLPLGILPPRAFEDSLLELRLAEGERVCAYSDGVIEVLGPGGQMFGQERLQAALEELDRSGVPLDALRLRLAEFAGGRPSLDDLSIVEVRHAAGAVLPAGEPVGREGRGLRCVFEVGVDALADDVIARIMKAVESLPELEAHRPQLFLVLSELYNNAVEHGLLALSSADKQGAAGFEAYYAARHAGLAALSSGGIRVELEIVRRLAGPVLLVRVTDTGHGFEQKVRPVAADALAGRGLALLRSLGATVTVHPPGNSVSAELPLVSAG